MWGVCKQENRASITTVDTMRQSFGDVLVMFDLQPWSRAHELVDAACVLLGTELETESVLALASLTDRDACNGFVMAERVTAARADLGMPALDRDARLVRAAQVIARRWQEGGLTDHELARWAHNTVTHWAHRLRTHEVAILHDLVMHYGVLEELQYSALDGRSAHQRLVEIVATLLGLPDPWCR